MQPHVQRLSQLRDPRYDPIYLVADASLRLYYVCCALCCSSRRRPRPADVLAVTIVKFYRISIALRVVVRTLGCCQPYQVRTYAAAEPAS